MNIQYRGFSDVAGFTIFALNASDKLDCILSNCLSCFILNTTTLWESNIALENDGYDVGQSGQLWNIMDRDGKHWNIMKISGKSWNMTIFHR